MPRGKSIITNNPAAITIEEGLRLFKQDCISRNLRAATIQTYDNFLMSYANWVELQSNISVISKQSITDWILNEKQEEKIKDVTLASKVRHVRAWVYFLQREGHLPHFKITIPKFDEPYKEPYTDAELAALLRQPTSNSFVEWRTWCFISFLIGTGCRISTALSVKISAINFSENVILFDRLKNRSIQLTPLSYSLKKTIRTYLSLWDYKEDDYLFNSSYADDGSEPIAKSTIQQEIKSYNNRRGVKKSSAHLFRHTFAKNYIKAGGGVFQLQRILGHADITTTRHYVNLYGSDLQQNYDNLCPLDNILREG